MVTIATANPVNSANSGPVSTLDESHGADWPARKGRGMIVSMMCAFSMSCTVGQPVAPNFEILGSSYLCGRIKFRITGPTTVLPDWPDRPCSGSPPLAIIDAGTMTWDEADNRTLTVPLRIVNRGTVPAQLPIRMILPLSGKDVLDPPEYSTSSIVPLNQDSTRSNGTLVWLVGGSGVVAPGDSSPVRTILFRVESPVVEGRLEYTITTESADTVRPALPDSTVWPTTELLVPSPWDSSLSYYRDVFQVAFDDSTSGAGVRNFLAHFSATIIGGAFHFLTSPYYIVRTPDPGPTWAAVDSVVQAMNAWPGVDDAGPAPRGTKTRIRSRYPADGPAAPSRTAWGSSSSDPLLWPWKSIRAPLAWGCENGVYGASRVSVGVVEFFVEPGDVMASDLTSSLSAGGGTFLPRNTDLIDDAGTATLYQEDKYHAQLVAGIATAAGDNGEGIAGMVWGSKLTLYALYREARKPKIAMDVLSRHLSTAVHNEDRVVNFSFGLGEAGNPQEVAQARKILKAFLGGSPQRLLVIAAGNDTLSMTRAELAASSDSRIAATDRAAAELLADPAFSGKILIVTGSNQAGGRWVSSSGGANVWTDADVVAAPAERVISVAGSGTLIEDGTSLAAPFVTGLAAQLWSMNPSLTAAEVKDYILRGAITSPSPSSIGFSGVFRIDAYQSLKVMASEHPMSSSLCGNRIYTNAGSMLSESASGAATAIFSVPGAAWDIRVHHGGRRIDWYDVNLTPRSFARINSAWTSIPATDTVTNIGPWSGAYYSLFANSHDGDSVVVSGSVPSPGSGVPVTIRTGGTDNTIIVLNRPPPSSSADSVCAHEFAMGDETGPDYQCVKWVPTGTVSTRGVVTAYSPMGDRVIVGISRATTTSFASSGMSACPWSTIRHNYETDRCIASFGASYISGNSELVSVRISNPADVTIANTSLEVWELAMSEDGTEIVADAGVQSWSVTESPKPGATLPEWEISATGPGMTSCSRVYWYGTVLPLQSKVIPTTDACDAFGGGTFSARKGRPTTQRPQIP